MAGKGWGKAVMIGAVACLQLIGCEPSALRKDASVHVPSVETETVPVAPVEGFNFGYEGANFVIRLEATLNGAPGDLAVTGFDPTNAEGRPKRLSEVVRAVCESDRRVFDDRALVRREHEDTVWTYVGACL